jgi:retinol dehydrogenase-12
MKLPDLSGKVVLITGGNSGVGRATAARLAGAGATTVLTSRDSGAGATAVTGIRNRTGNDDVHALVLDLGSFTSVRSTAAGVLSRWDRLDVLINNAGAIITPRRTTAEGHEMTFGVNHLGHFLLTNLLLDRLLRSAPSRIVNVTSVGHRFVKGGGLDFDDLQSERNYMGNEAYLRSKLANILFTKELARRLDGTGVTAYAVHPGTVRTRFAADGDTRGPLHMFLTLLHYLSVSPKTGSTASVHAATHPGIEHLSGAYLRRVGIGPFSTVRPGQPSPAARDPHAARRLWEVSEALCPAGSRP